VRSIERDGPRHHPVTLFATGASQTVGHGKRYARARVCSTVFCQPCEPHRRPPDSHLSTRLHSLQRGALCAFARGAHRTIARDVQGGRGLQRGIDAEHGTGACRKHGDERHEQRAAGGTPHSPITTPPTRRPQWQSGAASARTKAIRIMAGLDCSSRPAIRAHQNRLYQVAFERGRIVREAAAALSRVALGESSRDSSEPRLDPDRSESTRFPSLLIWPVPPGHANPGMR
jgi:hypothetical protein